MAKLKFNPLSTKTRIDVNDDGEWKTIKGRRVFIRKGENPTQAINRDIKERAAGDRSFPTPYERFKKIKHKPLN